MQALRLRVEKFVHGGQALATLSDGKKVFLWNALPGELVNAELKKIKKGFAEGVATEIIESSCDRNVPRDEAFLSTSPWQIMSFEVENKYKKEILIETFEREHIELRDVDFFAPKDQWFYRNKMEYSFWGDDSGLHLALFHRASHGKRIVQGSSIAMPEIDAVATRLLAILNKNGVRASSLKTVILRANQDGEVVVALFVKDPQFVEIIDLSSVAKGLVVYYSNPKSPASVITSKLFQYGNITLSDTILGTPVSYDVNSFFQVNIEAFSCAAAAIREQTKEAKAVIDMYAGVGTIGLICGAQKLVEIDSHNTEMAKQNAKNTNIEVIGTPAELALDYIQDGSTIIVDPPRAGLHSSVIERLNESKPAKIIYLSCNPITQARDVGLLSSEYEISDLQGYNFFPRTPHIESLAILTKK